MNIARSHTKDMPEVTEISKAELVYDDEQSAKKCVECKLVASIIKYINYNNKYIIFSNSRIGKY